MYDMCEWYISLNNSLLGGYLLIDNHIKSY